MSALVVEDCLPTRQLIVSVLMQMGISEIFEANDGAEGLKQAVLKKPKIIVSDLYMYPVNAFSMVAGIRHCDDHEVARTPIILFTSETQGKVLEKIKHLGVNILMIKPFIASVFSKNIIRLINTYYVPTNQRNKDFK